MAPSRIYLVGTTGHPNYGDELIGASWLRYLARTCPDAAVWLETPPPGGSELLLGHLHPNVRFVDTVFQLAWASPSEEPWVVADFVANATRNPGVVPRRAAGGRAAPPGGGTVGGRRVRGHPRAYPGGLPGAGCRRRPLARGRRLPHPRRRLSQC